MCCGVFVERAVEDRFTPKQVARAFGVSEATIKRWCDKGLLVTEKTPGGHRRIPLASVMDYLRTHGRRAAHPEVLGLPAATSTTDLGYRRALEVVLDALERGDEQAVIATGMGLYLDGAPIWSICDRVIAPAFHVIGHHWSVSGIHVYQERRACEITMTLLHRLREGLPEPREDAPLAIGGTLENDPYMLPSAMVELTLRDLGWQATNLGNGLPVTTLAAAIDELRPRLFWLSVSTVEEPESLRRSNSVLHVGCIERGAAYVVGGRGLTEARRSAMTYTAYCEDLQRLVGVVKGLEPSLSVP